jgi:hypothetical protein
MKLVKIKIHITKTKPVHPYLQPQFDTNEIDSPKTLIITSITREETSARSPQKVDRVENDQQLMIGRTKTVSLLSVSRTLSTTVDPRDYLDDSGTDFDESDW